MFQLKHTGTYVCQAVGYTKTYPGATRSAYLLVKSKYIALSNIQQCSNMSLNFSSYSIDLKLQNKVLVTWRTFK